jgi:hypothetical protein
MHHARTRSLGLAVHQDTSAVAYGAKDQAAEGVSRGPIGTRQAAREPLRRTMPSTAPPLVLVDAAAPCGSWLSRALPPTGQRCGVGAPARMPPQAADRGNTDRRDAVHLARLLRAGALTRVDVPTVDDAASRTLARAREEASHALKTATLAARRAGPPGAQPMCGGAPQGAAPPRRTRSSSGQTAARSRSTLNASTAGSQHCRSRAPPGDGRRWSRPGRACVACRAPGP